MTDKAEQGANCKNDEARMALADRRWYLGAMNDGLFIIDTPPRPSTDDQWHDRPDGPTLVINVTEMSPATAQEIVAAHNAALQPGELERKNDSGRNPSQIESSSDTAHVPLSLAQELSEALMTLRPLGGSECLSRHYIDGREYYFADTTFFRRVIQETRNDAMAGKIARVKAPAQQNPVIDTEQSGHGLSEGLK